VVEEYFWHVYDVCCDLNWPEFKNVRRDEFIGDKIPYFYWFNFLFPVFCYGDELIFIVKMFLNSYIFINIKRWRGVAYGGEGIMQPANDTE